MNKQIILDTETTGLSTAEGHRLIEIGCVEMINRRFTGRFFHQYLNPQRAVDQGALAVHGLSDEFLRDKPLFSTIVQEFLAFIADAELIIHNAPFDIGFLNDELMRLDKNAVSIDQRCKVIDTLVLARNKHPGQLNNLDALCRRYQVNNSNRNLHGALIDAQLLGQVYLAMTGGQEQLFGNDEPLASTLTIETAAVSTITNIQRQPLPIIQPTVEEFNAHQVFLELLTKSGHCIQWR